MKKILSLLVIIYFLLFPSSGWSATIYAESCSIDHVNAAISAETTVDGDIIQLPTCTVNWDTSGGSSPNYNMIYINKAIHLKGNGVANTKITITGAPPNYYAAIKSYEHASWRISDIAFDTANSTYSAMWISGAGSRVDSNKFTGFKWAIIAYSGTLIDNNEFYGGGIQRDYGSGTSAWASNTGLGAGGTDYLYIENNKFSNVGALTKVSRFLLTYSGAKFVFRYNTILSENTGAAVGLQGMDDIVDAHGYCHATSENSGRGTRAYEIYNNLQTKTDSGTTSTAFQLRSGTGVVYGNKVLPAESYSSSSGVLMYDWRAQTWNSTGGNTCYAVAPNTGGKYYCWSNVFRLQLTAAVHTDIDGGAVTVTGETSGASGVTSGFSGGSPGYLYFQSITNGPFQSGENLQVGGVTKNVAAANSEAYSGEGYPCTDQVGRGKDQASEPVYIWGNTDTNGNPSATATLSMVSGYITEDTDYILSEKAGYTKFSCPYPLDANGMPAPAGEVTGTCGTGAGQSFYTRDAESVYAISATGTNLTVSPTSQGTTSAAVTITVTPDYGYTPSCSGCSGSLSGTTYTTGGSHVADCTVTCTGLGKRAVLGGTGTVSLGGSGVALLGN